MGTRQEERDMGSTYESIGDEIRNFVAEQHVFFVASAPSEGGHVNLSPKGLDTFRIVDDHSVAYLDLTGSGAETAAHLRDNGRITLMFCAFAGRPRIVRFSGRGVVTTLGDADYEELAMHFANQPGARAVITVDVERIADSCGFSIPNLEYVGERDVLTKWAARQSPEQLDGYRREKNARSIDDLPALWAQPPDST